MIAPPGKPKNRLIIWSFYNWAQELVSMAMLFGIPLLSAVFVGYLGYPNAILTTIGVLTGSTFGFIFTLFILIVLPEPNKIKQGDWVQILTGTHKGNVVLVDSKGGQKSTGFIVNIAGQQECYYQVQLIKIRAKNL